MGAKLYVEFREKHFQNENCIIITHEKKKIKSISIAEEKKIPIVHMEWVNDCEFFMEKLDY